MAIPAAVGPVRRGGGSPTDGSDSCTVGMTSDEAWDLTIHGTDELEELVRGIARAEKASA